LSVAQKPARATRRRVTDIVGAPPFPIIWERVGVDDVHTSVL
jgi:hypothetical protein